MYVDDMMVPYNSKYCSFKHYFSLKLVSCGIKVWCLACSMTKINPQLEGVCGDEQQGALEPSLSCVWHKCRCCDTLNQWLGIEELHCSH